MSGVLGRNSGTAAVAGRPGGGSAHGLQGLRKAAEQPRAGVTGRLTLIASAALTGLTLLSCLMAGERASADNQNHWRRAAAFAGKRGNSPRASAVVSGQPCGGLGSRRRSSAVSSPVEISSMASSSRALGPRRPGTPRRE